MRDQDADADGLGSDTGSPSEAVDAKGVARRTAVGGALEHRVYWLRARTWTAGTEGTRQLGHRLLALVLVLGFEFPPAGFSLARDGFPTVSSFGGIRGYISREWQILGFAVVFGYMDAVSSGIDESETWCFWYEWTLPTLRMPPTCDKTTEDVIIYLSIPATCFSVH